MIDIDTLLNEHTPSISEKDESDIDDLARAYVVAMDEAVDAADLALRTCHCGVRIDGFYDYVSHLREVARDPQMVDNLV